MHDMNENSLLQEIEADLARQQYEKIWRKYGPYLLGTALLIVAFTAGHSFYKTSKTQAAQKTTLAYLQIFEQKRDKPDELVASLQAFEADNKGTVQAVFARLKAASTATKAGDSAQAIKLYDELAADEKVEQPYRQLADLLAVQLQLDAGDGAALEARLQPLMKADGVWRFTAKEYAGYLALRLGNKAKAKTIFSELKGMDAVPSSIAARATDIVVWLDGGA